jgi:amino acid transporter
VASKLLGKPIGVVSGCALLVDYALTITISIAAAGDALFSILPFDEWWKFPVEVVLILALITLNIRGVRESVMALLPIFLLFVATHIALIGFGIIVKLPDIASTARHVGEDLHSGLTQLGAWPLFLLFLHAYSLGGGTYTGIEAVSNGLPILREPRVQNGKRTMFYMAASLTFTATGLLLCYLLWDVGQRPGKTLNAVLAEKLMGQYSWGPLFVVLALVSEGALLVVAAQTGFLGGPRVLSNMAVDSWMPRRFAALSERLTTQNGIVLMGVAALGALYYTGGNVSRIVIMYSINVFLTFSISMFALARYWLSERGKVRQWKSRLTLFTVGLLLCGTILVVTVIEKFTDGAWLTLAVTGTLVALCFVIHGHYARVAKQLRKLYAELEAAPRVEAPPSVAVDPSARTAAILVAGYGGIGIHTVYNILRVFPGDYKNLVFLSVGVIDSDTFKGEEEIEKLKQKTKEMLERYVELGRSLGLASTFRLATGTDVVAEAEKLCLQVAVEFPKTTFFIGKVIFQRETWYHRLLHNETAFAVQKRLEWAGKPMVILPSRIH